MAFVSYVSTLICLACGLYLMLSRILKLKLWVQGLEAIARLRCSKGLAVDKYMGHAYRRTLTDLEFPNLSCEHSLVATLRYEDRLAENGGEACVQFATLFTTPAGQRRIRYRLIWASWQYDIIETTTAMLMICS